jgi:hypothetical protein
VAGVRLLAASTTANAGDVLKRFQQATAEQYKTISGRWDRYLSRLCSPKTRRGILTVNDCLQLLEKQDYKCALTGVEMTCILEKGKKTRTNVSIDRIDPKGGYRPENIQLVCTAVNSFRADLSIADFIEWCRKVVSHAIQKQSGSQL